MSAQDFTFALRTLRKSPGFTTAAVLATALGIGANAAIFTVVKHVLLQPLPFPEPSRLVDVNEYTAGGRAAAVSPPNFMDWRAQNQTLSGLTIYGSQVMTLSSGADPVRVPTGRIEPALFDVLSVRPHLGRPFVADDVREGARSVVLLGHALWQRSYGGDPGIVGRIVVLEGMPHEVVGVMPGRFDFPDESELWTPLRVGPDDLRASQRGAHYLSAVGRLRDGVTVEQAGADLDRIEQDLARQFPDTVAGYSVRAGRTFDARDSESGSRVAIVGETAARRFWPGENPIGRQIRIHVNERSRSPREIVGVVGDVRTRGLELEPVPVIYLPHAQYGGDSMTIVARTAGDPLQTLPAATAALRTLAPGVALSRAQRMEDLVAANVAEPRFRSLVLALFAAASLALAAVGLYGVVAFSVSQRRGELGLRLALGADPSDVLRLVMKEGMVPVAVGIGAGLMGAALVARVMQSLLFGVGPLDPVTFGAVAVTLSVVAFAACYVPARRAMSVDPAETLR